MVSLFFLHFATTVPHTVISNSEKFTHPILQYSSCQHLTLPAGPASLHRCTLSMSLYTYSSWFNYQRRCVASPPLSYLGILFIYDYREAAILDTFSGSASYSPPVLHLAKSSSNLSANRSRARRHNSETMFRLCFHELTELK